MNESFKAIVWGLVAALVVGGLTFLTDRFFDAFWPTFVVLLTASLIAFLMTALALSEPLKTAAAGFGVSLLIWGAIFYLLGYMNWERGTLSPVWFAAGFAVVTCLTFFTMERQHTAQEKRLGIFNACPKCGTKLKYQGEEYAGSTVEYGAPGTGYKTANYESVFACGKCGYRGARA